jgi:Na+-driven multidrug efflux pump
MSLFYILLPLGFFASVLFQGIGKGTHTLLLTFIREVLLTAIFAYILAIVLEWGVDGVWWGLVIGSSIGSIIAYLWSNQYIKKLIKTYGE